MRLLPALTTVGAVICMAVPAHADTDPGDDHAFLAAMTKAGITYQSPDRAIAAGRQVCDLANSGTTQLDILRDIRDLNPGFTMDGAVKFAQVAAGSYCPDRLNPDGDHTK
jgi:hypothetical protein